MSVKLIPLAEPFEERVQNTFHRKGVIYVIQNMRDGRCYVGQTVKTFAKRYGGIGMWWDHTTNRALLADLARYGTMPFRVHIVAHSKTKAELNELEKHYAVQYNAYFPHGYNLRPCGAPAIAPKRPHIVFMKGPFALRNPEGEAVNVTDIEALCEQHGLEKYQMWKLLKKEAKHLKGWTLADAPLKTYRGGAKYVFYDQSGKRYDVHCLRRFCDERKLHYDRMVCMGMGRTPVSQGFALTPTAFAKQRHRCVVTLTKEGREVTLHSIIKDAHLVGIDHRYIYDMVKGKKAPCDGWTVKETRWIPVG